MKRVFADTSYWIASILHKDSKHFAALQFLEKFDDLVVVTSELVFAEMLNYLSNQGPFLRKRGVDAIIRFSENMNTIIYALSEISFKQTLDFYRKHLDKNYSFIDCSSMVISKDNNIRQILTTDHHFEQEGFEILLK